MLSNTTYNTLWALFKPGAMHISSSVQGLWVCHFSGCWSHYIQILLACLPSVCRGHLAGQILRKLTILRPGVALLTTSTYPCRSANRKPPSAPIPGGQRGCQPLVILALFSGHLYPLQPQAVSTHFPLPILRPQCTPEWRCCTFTRKDTGH